MMSNPLFATTVSPQNRQPQSPSIMDILKQVKTSSNPQQTMENILFNNPNFQQVMSFINQNGGDAKSAFYNLAAQKGVNPEDVLKQLR